MLKIQALRIGVDVGLQKYGADEVAARFEILQNLL